jgi:hypothetical protein
MQGRQRDGLADAASAVTASAAQATTGDGQ